MTTKTGLFGNRLLFLVLLPFFLLLSGCEIPQGSQPTPTPAPTTVQNTSPTPAPVVAVSPTPTVTPVVATPTPVPKSPEVLELERQIELFNGLKAGNPPQEYDLSRVLPVALDDEAAVKAQIEKLENGIAERTKQIPGNPDPALPELQNKRDRAAISVLQLPKSKRATLAEKEKETARQKIETEAGNIAREVTALETLQAGKLPEGFDVRKLFEVDPLDEDATKARVDLLKSRIEEQTKRLRELGVLPAIEPEKPTQAPPTDAKATNETPTEQTPAESKPETNAPNAPVPALPSELYEHPDPAIRILALQLRRNALRLAFLTLPLEQRKAMIEADDKRRRIAQEQAAAEKSRLEAERAEHEAEAARQEALRVAEEAAGLVEKAIAGERARAEQTRGMLAGLRQQISEERQSNADAMQKALEKQDEFRSRLLDPELNGKDANQLYDEIVLNLTQSRQQLAKALDRLTGDSRVPTYKPEIDIDEEPYKSFGPARDKLKETIIEINGESAKLKQEENESVWARTVEAADDVRLGNDLRLELLPKLTSKKRRAVLGYGRQGIAQAKREINQLKLMSRFYVYQSQIRLQQLLERSEDIFTLSAVGLKFFELLILLVIVVIIGKNQGKGLNRLHAYVISRPIDPAVRVALDRWLRFTIKVAPSALFLLFIYLAFRIIDAGVVSEVAFLRTLLITYGWYRLILAIIHRYITGSARSRKITVSDELSGRIMRSVRLVLRYVFPVIVFLVLSREVLGRGYLYKVVVDFAWIGAIPLAVILLFRWRPDITAAYLNAFPESALADGIRRSNKSKPGLIKTAIAFVFVTGRWLRKSTSDTLSRFKHTRKAFAYFFRKQLEKQAEADSLSAVEPEPLPESLLATFSEKPVDSDLRIDHFPGLDRYAKKIDKWKHSGAGTAIALVGESGIGKTTWLREAQERFADVEPIFAEVEITTVSPDAVIEFLGNLLDIQDVTDPEQFIAAVKNGPKRLVILDQCQNLVFRSVGGMEGFKVFGEIIGRTVPHIFWLCAFSQYAWEYADSVMLTRNIFREIYRLTPWDEPVLTAMIDRRMQAAGYTPSFEDLIIDRVEGTEFENEVIRTGERFRRLLWDYSDGIPRVAVHFWLKSLYKPSQNTVKVRLFAAPSPDVLEELNEKTRFVLSALVVHQNLSIAEAAMVLNYPEHVCELIMGFLVDREFVQQNGRRFYVRSQWHRAIVRYLKRKHLLYS